MLAKINLKTVCGCTHEYFRRVDYVPREVRVPIKATVIPWRAGRITPMEVHSLRLFKLVRYEGKSSRRVELWCEEEVSA